MNSKTKISKIDLNLLKSIVLDNLSNEEFDVKSLATKAGLNRSQLYRQIKRNTGKSVTEFIRDIRLNKALEYLSKGKDTASEVSYQVGFHSPTYFNKCFKEKFGFTPGDTENHPRETEQLLNQQNNISSRGHINRKAGLLKIFLWASLLLVLPISLWYYQSPIPEASKIESPPADKSVAVLPLLNWTGEEEYDYICYGVTNALITELIRSEYFDKVTPINNVLPFKDSVVNIREVSKRLEVVNLLYGSLEKAGSKLKFSLQFINPGSGEIVWTHDFLIDWNPEDAFSMQQDIAKSIIFSMGDTKYTCTAWQEGSDKPETVSATAFDLRNRGIFEVNTFTKKGWENGISLFEKALKDDPGYFEVYRDLAYAWKYGGLIWAYCKQEEAWTKAKYYIKKGLELYPDDEELLALLKDGYFYYELKYEPQIEEYPELKYIRIEDHNIDFAQKSGLYQRAAEVTENRMRLNPDVGANKGYLSVTYYLMGELEKARELLDDNFEFHMDDLDFIREAAKIYFFLGDHDKMHVAVNTFFQNFEERPPVMFWAKAVSADLKGNNLERNKSLEILNRSYLNNDPGSPAWFLAMYYAYKKDIPKTLDWLEKSHSAREVEMSWLAQEPSLDFIGNEPRYIALLDSINFPNSARKHVDLIN